MASQTPLRRNKAAENAQQFVVIGQRLRDYLDSHDIFREYFQTRQDKLKYLDDIDEFNIDKFPNLSETLFIIKHFDFNPNQKSQQLTQRQTRQSSDKDAIQGGDQHPNGYNNNHLANPNVARVAASTVDEESEVESVGYTTDYGDIDEEPMQVDTNSTATKSQTDSDYDGGHCFNVLSANKCSIMGPMALLQIIRSFESRDQMIRMIPPERPLFSLAMHDTLITFSGMSSKQEAQQLLTLTRYMGAKSREDVTNKTTHLVAGHPRSLKYRRALELGLFIMGTNWVRESYQISQSDIDFEATLPEIIQHYKLKPFHGLNMAFVGFKEEEMEELGELTASNEGTIVEPDNPSCTHVVVDAISGFDDNSPQVLSSINQLLNVHVVYKEWFWASLEMEGKAYEDGYTVPGFKTQTPRRLSKLRRMSTGHASFSNVLSPMLDYSRSPDGLLEKQVSRSQSVARIVEEDQSTDLSKITARHRACLELLQTEKNYVRILETIVELFKKPLDKSLENPDINGPILPTTDVKIIFGNLMPIYEVHKKMLTNLQNLIELDWRETNCIGKIFVSHSIELIKAYPPFVNFFEDTKKTIQTCDSKHARFHAFLMGRQSRSECNRESLTEMIIRPVQRLPSISLLITELIKRTDESNPDKKYLIEALENIRRVMNLINEDKRKTEGQIAMFDIVNNIEDCPPNLLSAHRRFICKADARLLFMNSDSEVIPSRSHKVVLFLFSDLIEICKIRSLRRSQSSKNSRTYVPIRRGLNPSQSSKVSNKKDYRHLDELRLGDIMNFYKKCQSPEMSDAIVIQARPSPRYEQNFRYYPFIIDDESVTKEIFVERLEDCIATCDDPEIISEYVPNDLPPISNEEIDFGFANSLVSSMEKSRLSRVLSIRQSILSPSLKSAHKNLVYH